MKERYVGKTGGVAEGGLKKISSRSGEKSMENNLGDVRSRLGRMGHQLTND